MSPLLALPAARGPRGALVALVPALGLAAVGIGGVCRCPEHSGAGAAMAAAPSSGHAAAVGLPGGSHAAGPHVADPGPTAGRGADRPESGSDADGSSMRAETTADRDRVVLHAGTGGSPAASSAQADASGFQVGTRARPLIVDGSAARAWTTSGRGQAKPMAAMHAMAASRPTPSIATRAATDTGSTPVLTTAEATKRLSRRCRKLLAARSTKRMSRRDRARRLSCVRQRRVIVARSLTQGAPVAGTPGVSAPVPAIDGPAPATPTAPGTPTTGSPKGEVAVPTSPISSGTPSPTKVPTPTPTPAPAPVAGGPNPDDVMCSAVGLTATDADPSLFQMSRAVACPASDGKVYFELVNRDRQMHNLGIQTAGKPGTMVPAITAVEGGERASVAVKLAPGAYEVVCMVTGHGAMKVRLTILSKADYIAQGYAG